MPFRTEAITSTADERTELEQMTQSRTPPAGDVFRARLLPSPICWCMIWAHWETGSLREWPAPKSIAPRRVGAWEAIFLPARRLGHQPGRTSLTSLIGPDYSPSCPTQARVAPGTSGQITTRERSYARPVPAHARVFFDRLVAAPAASITGPG